MAAVGDLKHAMQLRPREWPNLDEIFAGTARPRARASCSALRAEQSRPCAVPLIAEIQQSVQRGRAVVCRHMRRYDV